MGKGACLWKKVGESIMHDERFATSSSTGIDAAEVVRNLWKARARIVAGTGIFTCAGIIYALLATPIFRATTTIMPPQQQQSAASAMLSALGAGGISGGGGGGIGAALGLKNPNDIYVALFKSRRVGDAIIDRYKLLGYYEAELRIDALKALAKASQINAGKDGLLTVQVEDKDPKLAADIANAYVEELRKMTKSLAVSEASQRRNYFAEQLAQVRDSLAYAEGQLRIFQERSGIIEPDAQGKASGEAMAELRSQVVAKEIEVKVMSQVATANNPQLKQLERALSGLRAHLAALTRGNGDEVWIAKGKAPELGLEYARKYRNVRYFESLFEFTAKQYEMAKMDESKDGMLIQVVDTAKTPESRERPKRSLIVILSMFFGAMISCTAVAGKHILLPNFGRKITPDLPSEELSA